MASTRTLVPWFRTLADAFIRWLRFNGVQVTVASARRDSDHQAVLYANYLAGHSKYPAARPGTSTHELGIAIDLHLNPPVYAAAGAAWERAGFTWGGRFADKIHFDGRRRV